MLAESPENATMAKTQKTFYLNDDLGKLVTILEQKSGASFTRIVSAALVRYLFEGFDEPSPHATLGPQSLWMRIAVMMERGDMAAEDIPETLLARMVDSAEQLKLPDEDIAHCKARQQGWRNSVEDFGGVLGAYADVVEGGFPRGWPRFAEEPKESDDTASE